MTPSGPGAHPPPPAHFADLELPLSALECTRTLRVHSLTHRAVYYGRSGNNRFDAPSGEYGCMYLALDIEGAFLEGLLHDRGLGESDRLLSMPYVRARRVSWVELPPEPRLVDLRGPGPAKLRADSSLCTGRDYLTTQAWARAIWAHPSQPQGIVYPARHDSMHDCVALFDRAGSLFEGCIGTFLDGALLPTFVELLERYQVGLSDT